MLPYSITLFTFRFDETVKNYFNVQQSVTMHFNFNCYPLYNPQKFNEGCNEVRTSIALKCTLKCRNISGILNWK